MSDASFIPDQAARQFLATRLNLDYSADMQDWEYEIADPTRLDDFLNLYQEENLTGAAKISLMEIILDSLNDLLVGGNEKVFLSYWFAVQDILTKNFKLHKETLNYWTVNNFEISYYLKKQNCR